MDVCGDSGLGSRLAFVDPQGCGISCIPPDPRMRCSAVSPGSSGSRRLSPENGATGMWPTGTRERTCLTGQKSSDGST